MIYERIRDLRADYNYTQTQLAEYLHISQRAYSRYENGERGIPLEILSRLADFYCTSTDYLLNRTDQSKAYPCSKIKTECETGLLKRREDKKHRP